jgi:hypothetical protein
VPYRTSLAASRILERLVLQSVLRKSHLSTIGEKALAVGRDEMRHQAPSPHMAMQPEPALHSMNHPLPPFLELAVRGRWFSHEWITRGEGDQSTSFRVDPVGSETHIHDQGNG